MTAETRPEANSEMPGGATLPSASRRRLFKGAAGSAGVLLSVHAKTALGAGVCRSPSAIMSGNTSPRPNSGVTCSGGRSPGFWKVPQKFNYWATAGAVPPTFNVAVNECATGMQNLTPANIATQGTLIDPIFPGAPSNTGIWAVMAFPNSFSGGQLMRHLSAAWLNAGYFTAAATRYPLTRLQILDMWNATKGGGLYCPGTIGGCGTSGWTSAQVISYISGMYDLNSNVEPDLCQPR